MTARPSWHTATVRDVVPATPAARVLVLDVPSWPGNDAGQHLDVRLTAPDGYQAVRSYSVATAGPDPTVELAVERVAGGEVSPFLVDELRRDDVIELRGPLGGWFVWRPEDGETRPVQLVAGGSGVVPMVAMARAHRAAGAAVPMRLLHAVRRPEDAMYAAVLAELVAQDPRLLVERVHSREAPPGSDIPPGRLTRDRLARLVVPPSERPRTFVCGTTPFVEQVLRWLADLGHDLDDVRAERFGGAG